MGYLFGIFLLLTFSLITMPVVVPKKTDALEKLAESYARSYLVAYYQQYKTFPDSFDIPFYPVLSYSKTASAAKVRLAGRDRKLNTGDDIVVVVSRDVLDRPSYLQLMERAQTLEQLAYNICQRRLSRGITPIFPSSLTELLDDSQLPHWYGKTPSGSWFVYDTSSCKTDYCYCSRSIVRAP